MKLQTKLILTLLSAILAVFVAAQIFQQISAGRALNRLSRENIGLVEQREQVQAGNIFEAIDPVIQQAISLGNMVQIDQLITNYNHIAGILEYSIYNKDGEVTSSTSREIRQSKKKIPADIKSQLLTSPARLSRLSDGAFEIYQPMVVTAKCLECHEDVKQGQIGGIEVLRLSADTLATSKKNWTAATSHIQRGNLAVAGITTLAVVAVVIVVAYWIVKRLITVPLSAVISRLTHGAEQINGNGSQIATASQSLAESAS